LIFTRKPDSDVEAQPSARGGRPATSVVSVIGPELVVTGNLETTGELRIEGDVQGDVYAARIVVGEQARVVGDMVADEIDIAGVVQGTIRGNTVTFRTGSQVEGEVMHRRLTIEHGAYFEGKSRRSDNPTGQR
jgi:cytoskeletal protein CcmA (bactofilin family)